MKPIKQLVPDLEKALDKSLQMSAHTIANDLVELLENLNIDKCDVLGHSMGGKAVMHLAQKDASKITKTQSI